MIQSNKIVTCGIALRVCSRDFHHFSAKDVVLEHINVATTLDEVVCYSTNLPQNEKKRESIEEIVLFYEESGEICYAKAAVLPINGVEVQTIRDKYEPEDFAKEERRTIYILKGLHLIGEEELNGYVYQDAKTSEILNLADELQKKRFTKCYYGIL